MSRTLTVAALVLGLPLPAQVASTGPACQLSPTGGGAFFFVAGAPVAGQTVQLWMTSSVSATPPLHVFVLGLDNPGVTLPSCGCEVRSSLDLVLVAAPSGGPPSWLSNVQLKLPATLQGAAFFVQGVGLYPSGVSGVAPAPCTELGWDALLTNGVQLTIQ